MELQITRIDQSLPLPTYATPGSVAFDVYAREETSIASKSLGLVPTNLIVKVPASYVLLLASRSSTPLKKGLLTPHGIGIIDQDFCGPKDELRVQLYNFTEQDVTVARGERIAQILLAPIERVEFRETEAAAASRGGFGSTG